MKSVSKTNRYKLNSAFITLSNYNVTFDHLEKFVKGEIQDETLWDKVNNFIENSKEKILAFLEFVKYWTPVLVDSIIDVIMNYIEENY